MSLHGPIQVETPPIAAIKAVVDLFADLGIDPLHLHIDGARPTDSRPNLSAWCRYRTDFERVCQRLQLKATERRYVQPGQRHWCAERDDDTTRLLVQCVSFQHHADWEPRPTDTTEETNDE